MAGSLIKIAETTVSSAVKSVTLTGPMIALMMCINSWNNVPIC